ncbi:hypothetical protein [Streptomyces sp. NPDC003717]
MVGLAKRAEEQGWWNSFPTPDDMMAVEGSEHGGVRYEVTKEQWELR